MEKKKTHNLDLVSAKEKDKCSIHPVEQVPNKLQTSTDLNARLNA